MSNLIQAAYFSKNILRKKLHYHDCHQIIFIVDGEVEFCVNDATINAKKHDIAIFSRYENHSVNVCADKYERFVLRISPLVGKYKSRIYSILSNRPGGFCNIISTGEYKDEILHLFRRISEEYTKSAILSEEMLEALTDELMILLCRLTPESIYPNNHNAKIVHEIQWLFENDFSRQYTLSYLAKKYNISISSLSHNFKKITGVAVMDYLTSCRIASAKKLLAQTHENISEIVEKCGFSDLSNFSRIFKKLNGMSPSSFRKKYK